MQRNLPSPTRSKGLVFYLLVVLIGAVSSVWLVIHAFSSASADTQSQTNCKDFQETGRSVCGRFLEYWQSSGGLSQFGYPISPEFTEQSELNGKKYTVQYFERSVFEYHPENKAPYDVLLSQLGTYLYKQKYPQGVSASPVSSVTMTAVTAQGTLTPVPAVKGTEVTVGSKVVTTLIDQVQASVTGIHTGSCGTEMTWVLQTTNKGTEPFTIDLDKASLSMTDNTGKSYLLAPSCGGLPYSGSFGTPLTIVAGEVHKGYVAFKADNVSPDVRYFDFRFTLSHTPVTFRFFLP